MVSSVATFALGEVFISMLYFAMFFIWIWLAILVFSDIFRSHDLSGFAKVVWVVFIIVLPFLGVFVYLIARGEKMREHAIAAAQAQEEAMRQYVREAVGAATSPADELHRLAELKDRGVIDDAEFQRLKAKVVNA